MTDNATPRDEPLMPEAAAAAERDPEAGAGGSGDGEHAIEGGAAAERDPEVDASRSGDSEHAAGGGGEPAVGEAGPREGAEEAGPRDGAAEAAVLPVPARSGPRPRYAFLVIVSLLSLGADLGTKWWAKARLDPIRGFQDRRIEIIKGHLNLISARNPGGAWGILQDESESLRRPFFLLISVAAVVFILGLYRKLDPQQWALRWGLPLVLGGALGNLVDRIRYGYVVDFIQIKVSPTLVWPTFNVADIAIVVGVGLMAIDMFTARRPTTGGAAGAQKASAGGG